MYRFSINVTVTPLVETSPIQIPKEHIKIESLPITGNSKAQITLLPTGITVQHFEMGNRFKINEKIAMKKLYGRLEQLENDRVREEVKYFISFSYIGQFVRLVKN